MKAAFGIESDALMMEPFRHLVLEGANVRLEPLDMGHFAMLLEAGSDPSIYEWYTESYHTPDKMKASVKAALEARAAGTAYPFATVDLVTKKVVGTTRFLNIDLYNHRLEIGYTWINPLWQRTHINTEAKFLMLRHAFEEKKANRVEFQTDVLNEKSRNAILRLGAKEEGILRDNRVCESGRLRSSIYFSILKAEWPAVKARLQTKMTKSRDL